MFDVTQKAGGYDILAKEGINFLKDHIRNLNDRVYEIKAFDLKPSWKLRFDEKQNPIIMERNKWIKLIKKTKDDALTALMEMEEGKVKRIDVMLHGTSPKYSSFLFFHNSPEDPNTGLSPLRSHVTFAVGSSTKTGIYYDYNRNIIVSWKDNATQVFDMRTLAASKSDYRGDVSASGIVNALGVRITEFQCGKLLFKRSEAKYDEIWAVSELTRKGESEFKCYIVDLVHLRRTTRRAVFSGYNEEGNLFEGKKEYYGEQAQSIAIREISHYFSHRIDWMPGESVIRNFFYDLLTQPAYHSVEVYQEGEVEDETTIFVTRQTQERSRTAILTFPEELADKPERYKIQAINIYDTFKTSQKTSSNLYQRYVAYENGKTYRDMISHKGNQNWFHAYSEQMVAKRDEVLEIKNSVRRNFSYVSEITIRKTASTSGVFAEMLNILGKYGDASRQLMGAYIAHGLSNVAWAISYADFISSPEFKKAYLKEFSERSDINLLASYETITEIWTGKVGATASDERNITNVSKELIGMNRPITGGIVDGLLSISKLEYLAMGCGIGKLISFSKVLQAAAIGFGVYAVGDSVIKTGKGVVDVYESYLSGDGEQLANSVSKLMLDSSPITLGLIGLRLEMMKKKTLVPKISKKVQPKTTKLPERVRKLKDKYDNWKKQWPKKQKTGDSSDDAQKIILEGAMYKRGKGKTITMDELFALEPDDVQLIFDTDTIRPQIQADCVLQSVFHNLKLDLKNKVLYEDFIKGVWKFLNDRKIGVHRGLTDEEIVKLYNNLGVQVKMMKLPQTEDQLKILITQQGGSVPLAVGTGGLHSSHMVNLEGFYIKSGKSYFMVRDALFHNRYSVYEYNQLKTITQQCYCLSGSPADTLKWINTYCPPPSLRGQGLGSLTSTYQVTKSSLESLRALPDFPKEILPKLTGMQSKGPLSRQAFIDALASELGDDMTRFPQKIQKILDYALHTDSSK